MRTVSATNLEMALFGSSDHEGVLDLVSGYGLSVTVGPSDAPIPHSYWGDSEAGLHGSGLYVRDDTPLHSVLHELCHVVCMTPERRRVLERDAGGDDLEESSVCYLQILLADRISAWGRDAMMRDMDRWGYSFRLGSTRRWFEEDAADALRWLRDFALVDGEGRPTGRLR